MAKFELIDKYIDHPELLPVRATTGSAGYDFFVAENIIIPSYQTLIQKIIDYSPFPPSETVVDIITLGEIIKETKAKPTLVPTGIKCKLDPNTFLQLSVRSSCPLNYWLILANGVGIIDQDYYGNPDNDGHIFFQMINLSPFDIQLMKGDRIGQGIILPYAITENDNTIKNRQGGFGSTK